MPKDRAGISDGVTHEVTRADGSVDKVKGPDPAVWGKPEKRSSPAAETAPAEGVKGPDPAVWGKQPVTRARKGTK